MKANNEKSELKYECQENNQTKWKERNKERLVKKEKDGFNEKKTERKRYRMDENATCLKDN